MCFIGKEFEYRGFKTTVKFSKEDNLFYGKIENTTDLISFHSDNTEGFYDSFVDAVEDYLEFCEKVDKTPIRL